jgi:DNA-binding winged helix-turn-helix (wHTH) protein/Flp pilus assembly protein TadD
VTQPTPVLHFGEFVLDRERHVLTRGGAEITLSPHLVDILEFLASRPGEIVSKETLLDRFWRDVHITDNTLTRAIADIRKALGDAAASPRYIQTAARRGYRFLATTPPATHIDDEGFRNVVRGRAALETLDQRRLQDAVSAFEQAVAAMPGYAPAHTGLASARFLQHEAARAVNVPPRALLDEAKTHAQRGCELDATLGEAWATLGFVLTALGDGEQARAVLRRAAALEPSNWRHHFRLSVASWGEERLRACDRTLSLLPDFAPARFTAAMVFVARQAFDQALQTADAGAAAQSRQVVHEGAPFPAVGMHWLRGLLLLRAGRTGPAIQSFAREIEEGREEQIYAAEFRANAQAAAGFAHLAVGDAAGAIDPFRLVLEVLPHHGRALIGLYQALQHTTLAGEAALLWPQIETAVDELTRGQRHAEAAVIRAGAYAARGDVDSALETMWRLLELAPPGQAGWLIPLDPLLGALRTHARYPELMALLAARAA